jgi:hypothetical protein
MGKVTYFPSRRAGPFDWRSLRLATPEFHSFEWLFPYALQKPCGISYLRWQNKPSFLLNALKPLNQFYTLYLDSEYKAASIQNYFQTSKAFEFYSPLFLRTIKTEQKLLFRGHSRISMWCPCFIWPPQGFKDKLTLKSYSTLFVSVLGFQRSIRTNRIIAHRYFENDKYQQIFLPAVRTYRLIPIKNWLVEDFEIVSQPLNGRYKYFY